MPVSSEAFRHSLGRFASGVTIVTVKDANNVRHGLTVSAFSSVSLTPPYVLVCIDKRSSSIPVIERAGGFAVNILAEDQRELSNRFASKLEDKFEGVPFTEGPLGHPWLTGAVVQMECSVANQVDAGDHLIFIGQLESTAVHEEKQPLVYFNGQYGAFGS